MGCTSSREAKGPRTHVLLIGLDGAGSTTALYHLALGKPFETVPTLGFNHEVRACGCARESVGRGGVRSTRGGGEGAPSRGLAVDRVLEGWVWEVGGGGGRGEGVAGVAVARTEEWGRLGGMYGRLRRGGRPQTGARRRWSPTVAPAAVPTPAAVAAPAAAV